MNVEVRYRGSGANLLVGKMSWTGGRVFFQYDADWRGLGLELSPYVLPLSEDRAVAPRGTRFHGLYSLFSDSLPDWWGEKLMRRYLSASGRDWRALTPLDKLCFQGDRAMGALAYEPDLRPGGEEENLDVTALADAATATLAGGTEVVLEGLLRSGHSAGGAQPKVVLGISGDGQTVVSGEGGLPEGFSHWLVKFDLEPVLEDGRVEVACGLAGQAAGIVMPEVRVLEDGAGRAHFAVRRFDRGSRGERTHVQTFAALSDTPVDEPIDYADLLDLTRELTQDHRQVVQLFRRAVFNVLLRNEDDHGKNHSFLMDREGEWTLAPAYDLVQTGHPLGGGMRACGVLGRMSEVGVENLKQLAVLHGVKEGQEIIEEVRTTLSGMPDFCAQAGVSERRMEELVQGMRLP